MSSFNQRDAEIKRAFDDFRRTTAITCLITMRQLGWVTQAELDRFSSDAGTTTTQILEEIASEVPLVDDSQSARSAPAVCRPGMDELGAQPSRRRINVVV
jgi:hypothetical protein